MNPVSIFRIVLPLFVAWVMLDGALARAAVITWTGAAGDQSWHTAANWDLGRLPVNGDDVVIPGPASAVRVIFNTGTRSVRSITCDGTLELAANFPLPVLTTTTATVNGELRLGLAQLNVNERLTIDGLMTCSPGNIQGTGAVEIGSAGHVISLSGALSFRVPVTNHGLFEWRASALQFSGSGQFTNATDGTFIASGNSITSSGGAFVNQGTFRLNAADANTTINLSLPIQNSGVFRIERGRLPIPSAGFSSTPIQIDALGKLVLNTSSFQLTHDLPFTGDGEVTFASGAFAFDGALDMNVRMIFLAPVEFNADYDLSGYIEVRTYEPFNYTGRIGGTGDLTVSGQLVLGGPIEGFGSLTIAPGGLITTGETPQIKRPTVNHGRVEGSVIDIFATTLTNEADGVLAGRGFVSTAGPSLVINRGLIEPPPNVGGSSQPGPDQQNFATIHITSGTWPVTGHFLNEGHIILDAAGQLNLRGNSTFSPAGSISGSGRLDFGNATHMMDGPVSPQISLYVTGVNGSVQLLRDYAVRELWVNSGTLAGSGALETPTTVLQKGTIANAGGVITGTFSVDTGSYPRVIRNTLTVTSGITVPNGAFWTLSLDGGTFVNAESSLITVSGQLIVNATSPSVWRNNGQMLVNLECRISPRFENNGSVVLDTASLRLNGGGRNEGTINVPGGSTLSYGGDYDHSDVAPIGEGALNMAAGAHQLAATFPRQRMRSIESAATVYVDDNWDITEPLTLAGTLGGGGMKTLRATFDWAPGGRLSGPGTFVIPQNETLGSSQSGTRALQNTTLDNSGTLIGLWGTLEFRSATLINQLTGSVQLTNELTLANTSGINRIQNHGTFGTAGTGSPFATIAAPFDNFNLLTAEAGILTISGEFSNFQDGTLIGGSYRVSQRLALTNRQLSTVAAPVELLSSAASIGTTSGPNLPQLVQIAPTGVLRFRNGARLTRTAALGLDNAGLLDIGAGCTININGLFTQTAGETIANGTLQATNSAVYVEAGRLSGSGTIRPGLLCAGELSPGDPVGSLTVEGNCQLLPAATLRLELAGLNPGTEYDRMIVAGGIWLGGRLEVALIDDFQPLPDAEFDIVSGVPLAHFATASLPPLTAGQCWMKQNLADRVRLTVIRIVGDVNGDSATTLQDLAILLAHFGQPADATPADGDLDGDFDVDLDDLSTLLSDFGHICG